MTAQFFNTVTQILNSESVNPLGGIYRHLLWQYRRIFRQFPVTLRIADSRLRVDEPCGVAALINAMGEYDYNNMRFFCLLLSRSPGTFLDIGANIGSYTLVVSELSEAVVISIEPHPVTFGWLKENVRLNCRKNVTCLNFAVSDQNGHIRFTNGLDPSINRVVLKEGESNPATLSIESRRADALCQEFRISPDFVKIDVEGHELAVLQSLGSYRSFSKVIVVENGERETVRAWMKPNYAGPFYVHVDERVLSSAKQKRSEDSVYVNVKFLDELRGMGFSILAEG